MKNAEQNVVKSYFFSRPDYFTVRYRGGMGGAYHPTFKPALEVVAEPNLHLY